MRERERERDWNPGPHLVGVQHAPVVDLVRVIHVVEAVGCGDIQVERRAAPLRTRARRAQTRRHGGAQPWLLRWVQAAHHGVAVHVADGVRTFTHNLHPQIHQRTILTTTRLLDYGLERRYVT
jgi:hypothetical protein